MTAMLFVSFVYAVQMLQPAGAEPRRPTIPRSVSEVLRNLEQEKFWLGRTPADNRYIAGAQADFVTLRSRRSTFLAFCSAALQICAAYPAGDYLVSYSRPIAPNMDRKQAVAAYLSYLNQLPFRPGGRRLTAAEFQIEEADITLPVLSIPKELTQNPQPLVLAEAHHVWKTNLKPNLQCPELGIDNHLVRRVFLFARRATVASEWFVARVCQYSRGRTIQSVYRLSAAESGEWLLSAGGYMGTDEDPVVRHALRAIRQVLLRQFTD
jgi:hypothetical protein